MNALKIILVSLLGFFLTLSLLIFGMALTTKMTALNPNYVITRIDTLDVSALVDEALEEQVSEEDIPEEFTEEMQATLIDTIDRLEPLVKEQAAINVRSLYDYLLAKKDNPELMLTWRNTFLNSEFVTSFLNEIDISSMAETHLNSESIQGDLPEEFTEELKVTLVDTIDRLESSIKERISAVSDPVFDYMLGMSQDLDLASVIRNNLLDSEFIDSLLEEIDIPSLVEDVDLSSYMLDFIEEQSSEELPEEIEYLVGYVDELIVELEPWIREQLDIVADPVFDYLLGITQSINITVSMEPVKDALGDNLRKKFLESPPAELASFSQTELGQYFDEHYDNLAEEFSTDFVLDESVLGDLREDITAALADAEDDLEQAKQDIADALVDTEDAFEDSREYVGYFMLGFNLLILTILLLIAGIALVFREVKNTCRTLAGIFLAFGVLGLTFVLVGRAMMRPPLEEIEDIPPSLHEWIIQTASSTLTPLLILAIVLLFLGIALLVFSIFYARRKDRMEAESLYYSPPPENETREDESGEIESKEVESPGEKTQGEEPRP